MKLTPLALFSATKSDFTEWVTPFKLVKSERGPLTLFQDSPYVPPLAGDLNVVKM